MFFHWLFFLFFCWNIFVARMFLADSYVLVGGVFLQCPYQKMSVVMILQVPFINRNPQQVVGISMFEP